MPIRSDEIDPTIQRALSERLSQIFAAPAGADPVTARIIAEGKALWRETARRHAVRFWTGGGLMLALPVVAAMLGRNEGLAALGVLTCFGSGLGIFLSGFTRTRRDLTEHVSAELMRAASHLIQLERAEKAYTTALAELVEAEGVLGATGTRDLLQQFNRLLTGYRTLEALSRKARAGSGNAPLAQLESELQGLREKLAANNDEAARALLQESIALCGSRLEHARAQEPAAARAEAQRELIVQTLAFQASTLSRLKASVAVASGEQAEVELREAIERANQRATEAEAAARELLQAAA